MIETQEAASVVERAIRFRTLLSVLHNDFGLRGRGTIRIDEHGVEVTGLRRSGLRREPARLSFPAADVHDATSYGRLVWFMADPPAGTPGRPSRMAVYAGSDADAQAIFDALPRRMSEARARAHAEEDSFAEQLGRAVPRLTVTPALVAINVLVFLAMLAAGAGLFSSTPGIHIRWGSNYGPLTANGEWWRLVTNTFLHFGAVHILLNMWALFDAGRLAERLFGPVRFLAIYLVAGIGGSIASLAWNPAVNSAGASGAVFGVIGALLVYLLDRRNGVPMSVIRQHRFPLLAFIGYSLVYGFAHSNIDNAAHIGGLLAGAVAGFAWPQALDRRKSTVSTGRFALLAVIAAAVLAAAAFGAIRRADRLNEEARFRTAIGVLAASEQNLNVLTQEAIDSLQRGRLSREQAGERLENLSERWRALNAELVGIRLGSDSAFADLRTQLIRFSGLRAEGISLLATAVATGDGPRAKEGLALLVESRKLEANVQRALVDAARRR